MEKGVSFNETIKVGVLAAVIAAATPELASAGTVSTVLHSVATTQLSSIPWMLSVICYIVGAFLMISGALSLKKHAENPASEPMGKGIARLVTGGAITSVPALAGIIQRSVGVSGQQEATFTSFSTTF